MQADHNILIIDSSPIITERLQLLLGEIEKVQHVVCVGAAREGLALLDKEDAGIVLIDATVIEREGAGTIAAIREKGQATKVIVCMYDAAIGNTSKERLLEWGADYCIDKFSGFEEIVKIINKKH